MPCSLKDKLTIDIDAHYPDKSSQSYILNSSRENHISVFFTFLPFVALPTDRWTKCKENRCL